MQPFTQKYAIIQLFEDMPVGTEFAVSNWPLHSTVADIFAIDWDVPTMIEKLTELLKDYPQAVSVVKDDQLFGEYRQVRVALLEKTASLAKLHYDIVELLERGGWKPNNPQFAKEGFLPHSTVQSHGRVNRGDEVTFNTLSIIDFFPNKDPYQRKVLATIKINPIASELLKMSQADKEMRTKAQNNMDEWDDSIDSQNTARLKEIINKIGWPTISKVGEKASQAAWLLVQHAYAEPDFMKHCLELMKQTPYDVQPTDVAYLEDRLLTMEDKLQVYGTQFRKGDSGWEPFPIEDPEHVDERRASVGLSTLAENEARISATYPLV